LYYLKRFQVISSEQSIWKAGKSAVKKLVRIFSIHLFDRVKDNLAKIFSKSPKKGNAIINKKELQILQEKIGRKLRITFVVYELVYKGGLISIINLVNELILMGVSAKIVTKYRGDIKFNLYSAPAYLYENELLQYFPNTDLSIASFWPTAYIVHDLSKTRKKMKSAYFIQDYEAWFYPESDVERRQKIIQSYDLIKNKFAKTQWLKNKLEEDKHQCFKINPGLNTNIFYTLPRELKENLTIIAMYRPETPRRGTEVLLEVLHLVHKKYPQIRTRLFGNNPLDYPSHTPPFPFDYSGELSHEALVEEYRKSDICIETSHFHGFGRMGVEAMACGCACVFSDSGGVSEYAVDGENCLLARPGDVDQLFLQVSQLIENSALRQRLSRNGIKTAQRYEERIAATQFLDWAKKICNVSVEV